MGKRRGAPARIDGIPQAKVNELREYLAEMKKDNPVFDEGELLQAASKKYPTEVGRLRRTSRDPNGWVRRAASAEPVIPGSSSKFTKAMAILSSRDRYDLAEQYNEKTLRAVARRLRAEGAQPYRHPDEVAIAAALVEVGVLPWSILDPEEIEKVRRRVATNLEEKW